MELEAVLAVYGDDCAILDSFPPHLHLHSKPRTVDISSQQVHHSLSPSFTFGVCLFFGFEEQNSRKHFLGNKNDSYQGSWLLKVDSADSFEQTHLFRIMILMCLLYFCRIFLCKDISEVLALWIGRENCTSFIAYQLS